jgi:hypothetical protein
MKQNYFIPGDLYMFHNYTYAAFYCDNDFFGIMYSHDISRNEIVMFLSKNTFEPKYKILVNNEIGYIWSSVDLIPIHQDPFN